MSQIVMPQAGQSMEEGTIVRWLKAEGDAIAKGDVLFEIETDKSVIEVEASEAGVLGRILVAAGTTVAIKTPVAEMRNAECGMRNEENEKNEQSAIRNPQSASDNSAFRIPQSGSVTPVLMPKAGQSMEEGTLVKWRVAPGAMIKKGDVIFEVETDKSVVEVEATEEGRLARIVAQEGAVVPVLVPVAYIAENDADVDAFISAEGGARSAENDSAILKPQSAVPAPQPLIPAPQSAILNPQSNGGRVKASPAARKLAGERGIDLAAMGQGSGPGGRILSTDVAQAPASAEGGVRSAQS